MLSVNCGNGIDAWVRLVEGYLDPWFHGTAGCAHFCLSRAQRLSVEQPPPEEGVIVLALEAPQHELRRAVVGAEGARKRARVTGTVYVTFEHDGSSRAVPACRLVRWAGYLESLVVSADGGAPSQRIRSAAPRVSIFRSEIWTEGFFSQLFWAVGFLEHESRGANGLTPDVLLVDWTDERLLFHKSFQKKMPPNAWNSFFEPPTGVPRLPCGLADSLSVSMPATGASAVCALVYA